MTDAFDPDVRAKMASIEANWDARTPVHVASGFYDVDRRDPEFWFAGYEWDDLGDVAGRDVVHLQCHLGTETMAFARRGARTVGLDLSGAAVAQARQIADRAGTPVEYVHANVYDAADALAGRRFDIVYTGKGALCYLPDLRRWAGVVADLLRPGGTLYLVEFHPVLTSLGLTPPDDRRGAAGSSPGDGSGHGDGPAPGGDELLLRHDYLGGRGARHLDATRTYTDGPALSGATDSYEWAHGLGEVVEAVIAAGLRVTGLRESDELPWPRWPWLTPTERGWWRIPDDRPRIPLWYALRAESASA